MEEHIKLAAIFVLFASKKSIESSWVNFEVEQARFEKITKENFQILVFPASTDFELKDLPNWMQRAWVDNKRRSAKDVARYISSIILSAPFRGDPQIFTPRGRGQLLDQFDTKFSYQLRDIEKTPNVLVFSGIPRIGRRTFARMAVEHAYPALPRLPTGPTIEFNIWSDSADFYVRLRDIMDDGLSLDVIRATREAFDALQPHQKTTELVRSLGHFSDLGEAVFVLFQAGLFDGSGNLQSWVAELFDELASHKDILLVIITPRSIDEGDILSRRHVLQLSVPALRNEAIESIFINTCSALGSRINRINPTLLNIIGGHPDLARAAARLASQIGQEQVVSTPGTLFDFQDGLLKNNLSDTHLSPLQKAILVLLSWVPRLPSFVVRDIVMDGQASDSEFANAVRGLLLGCLIEYANEDISIASPIRYYVRRKFGQGTTQLLAGLATRLKAALDAIEEEGDVSSSLIDAAIFAIALAGSALPEELRSLISPSTLQRLVTDAYRAGQEDETMYRKAITWGLLGEQMRISEELRNDLLSTVCQSQTRLNEFVSARETIEKLDQRLAPQRHFLRGFLERQTGEIDAAISHFKKAVEVRFFRKSAVHQLGLCLLRQSRLTELRDLLNREGASITTSDVLLDLRCQFEILEGQYPEAEATIRQMRESRDEGGRSYRLEAWLAYKRDHNPRRAIDILSKLITTAERRDIESRYRRACIAATEGMPDIYKEDYAFISDHARYRKTDMLRRLRIRTALRQKDWRSAEQELKDFANLSHSDLGLKRRMLEVKSHDKSLSLSEIQAAKKQAQDIVVKAYERDLVVDEDLLNE
jgi:tetratricopeptide (TPR) repeat protein